MPDLLLDVQGLETQFRTQQGIVHAVNGVSFGLKEGETLGVVGESGCGKSVTMLSLLRLIPTPPGKIVGGKATFVGQDLLKMTNEEIRFVRGAQISIVFQDPMTSLNPVLTIGQQLEEPLMLHVGMNRHQARERAAELLGLVGIPKGQRPAGGLSPPILGGHAPARDDRHGAVVLAADPDRRRTHHRPGCDHPGADHRAGQTPARRAGHGDHLDHA